MSGRSDTVKHRLSVGWFARKGSASTFIVVAVSILYPPAIILYSFIGGGFLKFGLSLVGAAVFFIMFLKKTRVGWVRKGAVALILFSMIFWGWYGALWTGFKNYGVILILLSSLGVTWATLEFGLEKYVYEYPFVFFIALTWFLILSGVDHYGFNGVLAIGSRNVYSAILVALSVGYLYSRKVRGERTSVALGFAMIVASFILYSRTGVALGIFLFWGFLLRSTLFYRFGSFIILCLPGVFLGALFLGFFDFVSENTNFVRGIDSPRFEIWGSYLSSLDAFSFLFGLDVGGNDLISDYDGNAHSAYFRLHSYFGVGLFFLVVVPAVSLFALFKKREWFFISLFFCFFFRAAFDPVYFVYFFDYAFYPFVFFYLFDRYFGQGGFLVAGKRRILALKSKQGSCERAERA